MEDPRPAPAPDSTAINRAGRAAPRSRPGKGVQRAPARSDRLVKERRADAEHHVREGFAHDPPLNGKLFRRGRGGHCVSSCARRRERGGKGLSPSIAGEEGEGALGPNVTAFTSAGLHACRRKRVEVIRADDAGRGGSDVLLPYRMRANTAIQIVIVDAVAAEALEQAGQAQPA